MRNLKQSLVNWLGWEVRKIEDDCGLQTKTRVKPALLLLFPRLEVLPGQSYPIDHNTDTGYIFVEHGIGLFGHSEDNDKTSGYSHSCHRC